MTTPLERQLGQALHLEALHSRSTEGRSVVDRRVCGRHRRRCREPGSPEGDQCGDRQLLPQRTARAADLHPHGARGCGAAPDAGVERRSRSSRSRTLRTTRRAEAVTGRRRRRRSMSVAPDRRPRSRSIRARSPRPARPWTTSARRSRLVPSPYPPARWIIGDRSHLGEDRPAARSRIFMTFRSCATPRASRPATRGRVASRSATGNHRRGRRDGHAAGRCRSARGSRATRIAAADPRGLAPRGACMSMSGRARVRSRTRSCSARGCRRRRGSTGSSASSANSILRRGHSSSSAIPIARPDVADLRIVPPEEHAKISSTRSSPTFERFNLTVRDRHDHVVGYSGRRSCSAAQARVRARDRRSRGNKALRSSSSSASRSRRRRP